MRILLYLGIFLVALHFWYQSKSNTNNTNKNVVLLTPRTVQEGQGLYNENLPVDYIKDTLESASTLTAELAMNKWTNRDFESQIM